MRLLKNMNIFILTFHKYDKAFASDLYLIYNRSPAARVCKSDTDRLLMLYLVHKDLCKTIPVPRYRKFFRSRNIRIPGAFTYSQISKFYSKACFFFGFFLFYSKACFLLYQGLEFEIFKTIIVGN